MIKFIKKIKIIIKKDTEKNEIFEKTISDEEIRDMMIKMAYFNEKTKNIYDIGFSETEF